MHSHLLRSTPFRVAVILGITVFVALLIAGFVALELIKGELARRMDGSITDTFNVIAQAYGEADQADLLDTVKNHINATLAHEQIFAVTTGSGGMLAGNLPVMPKGSGWLILNGSDIGMPDDPSLYRAYAGDVQGNRLLVGQSYAESEAISRLALNSIAWAGVVILSLVTIVGVLLAMRAQHRITGIVTTMDRVARGELTARIPLGPRGDDIDLLARQVNAALGRLAALVDGMRQVSVNIAHDLKTPLNRLRISIEGAVEMASRGDNPSVLLAQVETELRQITGTFDALLRIAQLESGARRSRFVPVDLGTVLDRIGEAYIDVAEERGQHLVVRHEPGLPRIDGDSDLLLQLCANLLENAMRHTPAGTHILLQVASVEGKLVLSCADDGPGIDEAEREKVFERLYRVEKSRTTPGSGLGLTLAKAIAELHGATISLADNRPGLMVKVILGAPPARQDPAKAESVGRAQPLGVRSA